MSPPAYQRAERCSSFCILHFRRRPSPPIFTRSYSKLVEVPERAQLSKHVKYLSSVALGRVAQTTDRGSVSRSNGRESGTVEILKRLVGFSLLRAAGPRSVKIV